MAKYYSSSSKGFYDDSIHKKEQIPSDAVLISEEDYNNIFTSQSKGKIIQSDDKGYPIVVSPPPPNVDQLLEQIRQKRDSLLYSTDKYMITDYPLTAAKKNEWKTYRQQLRDFTSNVNLKNIVWPIPPSNENIQKNSKKPDVGGK